jgi:alpha-L-rhamnosidase
MGSGAGMQTDPFGDAKWLTVPNVANPYEHAYWIWVRKPGDPTPTASGATAGTVRLRQTWNLADKPTRAIVKLSADNSAVLRINGTTVGTADDWGKPFEFDVAKHLVKGANQIEVEATNGPGNNIVNPAGMVFEGMAWTPGGFSQLDSNNTWSSPDGEVVVIGKYGIEPWGKAKADVPPPVFVRRFEIGNRWMRNSSDLVAIHARIKIIGLGHYDLYVNGKRQGKGFLNQSWSQYDKTLYWQEFNVVDDLRRGLNEVRVVIGNSWYRVAQPPPGRYAKGDAMPDFSGTNPYILRFRLTIDGEIKLVSDESWRWTESPYTLSHVFAGEDYDARIQPNLESAKPVVIAAPPKAELRKFDAPPILPKESWHAIKLLNPNPGEWSYVFPQNAMAILRFKVKGKRGQTVKFRPSEVMNEKGEVVQLNLWGGEASCSYTLWGGKSEEHEWRFWYHGFQFVQMTGAVPKGKPNPDGLPVIEDLEMVHIRTDNPEVGKFQTSSDLYNRTHNLIDWAMKSNMSYVFTDCPQREKLGWQEQVYLLDRTFMYRYDVRQWFHKIARDLRDAQVPDGRFPTVAPDYLVRPIDDQYKFTVEWGASGVLMPWDAYEWYGDKRFLEENYEAMRRYVQFLIRDEREGLARKGLGDWYDYGHGQGPGPSRYTPTDLTSTCIYAMCVRALADAAEALGHAGKEVLLYRGQFAFIKQAFLKKFYDPATKTLKNTGSVQSGHAMALCADLIPTEDRAAVLQHIVDELEKRGYQQTAGDVGHVYFIRALAEAGRSDVLHKVYSRTGVGSYGGILAKGLTTMPETWDAITVGSNSLNHAMLGHVMEWFYGWVLGIRQAPGSVGWKHILIAPEFGSLDWAKGETRTPQGVVKVSWKVAPYVGGKTGGSPYVLGPITMEVDIPRNTTASIPTYGRRATVDGKRFEPSTAQPMISLGPGRHKVVLERP